MLDSDLAELYQVLTKNLNLAVRRNRNRFPEDFMFQLTRQEYESLRLQIGTSNEGRGGWRLPALCLHRAECGHARLGAQHRSRRADEHPHHARFRQAARGVGGRTLFLVGLSFAAMAGYLDEPAFPRKPAPPAPKWKPASPSTPWWPVIPRFTIRPSPKAATLPDPESGLIVTAAGSRVRQDCAH
jgi:ORF6N domain